MKKSRTVLRFIDFLSCRPLIVPAVLILLFDLAYVNLKLPDESNVNPNGQHVCIQGIARDKAFDENGKIKSITVGDTICYVNNVDAQIGSLVKLSGKAYPTEGAMNRGGFDQKKYYASKKIHYRLNTEKVIFVKPGRYSIKENFFKWRNELSRLVNDNCPYEAGTVSTLLLGDKSNLSEDRKALFKDVGISHFLVISGLHISIIGSLIFRFLKRLGIKRTYSCFFSMIIIFFYGLLVGFSISVIRAVIMYSFRLISYILKRSYDLLSALFFSVIINILINPYCVLDSAFPYSYVTVLVIGLYMDRHAVSIDVRSIKEKIVDNIKFSITLFLFMLPVSLRISNYYTLSSVFVNLFLAPLSLPVIILSGSSLLLSAFNLKALAAISSGVLAVLLRILDKVCNFFSSIDAFTFTGNPSILAIFIYMAFMYYLLFFDKKDIPKALKPICFFGLITLLLIPKPNSPSLSMLYVGQGECIVIKTGANSAIMMDCGSTSDEKFYENFVLPFLKEEGITTLSGIFVSHADKDHICGVPKLIADNNHIKIKHIYLPKIKEEGKNNYYKQTVYLAKENGIPLTYVERNMGFKFGRIKLLCLAPSYKNLSGDANKDSLILLLKAPNKTDILLTGDSDIEAQESVLSDILKYSDNRVEVLKVAHHGSKNSTSSKLLEAENPKVAIISAGKNNSYGHPHKEVINTLKDAGAVSFCTKDKGEIDVYITFKGIKVSSFCK